MAKITVICLLYAANKLGLEILWIHHTVLPRGVIIASGLADNSKAWILYNNALHNHFQGVSSSTATQMLSVHLRRAHPEFKGILLLSSELHLMPLIVPYCLNHHWIGFLDVLLFVGCVLPWNLVNKWHCWHSLMDGIANSPEQNNYCKLLEFK